MNRAILAFLLISFSLFAQTSDSPALLTFGPWAACEAGMFPADSIYCLGVTPGSETYQLVIPNGGTPDVIAYRYTVTATLKSGDARTLTGVLERAANASGYTFAILNFGGPLKDFALTVENLGVLSVRTRDTQRN
jgi:hypothetical protein